MKYISNKKNLNLMLIISGFVFISCLRDFDLTMPEVEKQIAVNCFFTPDTFWEAKVYFTHHIDSSGQNAGIENAVVTIEDSSGNALVLNSAGEGWYRAEERPVQGETYRLTVNVDGFKTVSAESYVPYPSVISAWVFHPGNKISFKITPANTSEFYASLSGKYFDPETGYNIYCIDSEIIKRLEENDRISPEVAGKIKSLEGHTLYSYNVVEKVQELLTDEENFHYWHFIQTVFETYAVCGKLGYRPRSLVFSGGCTSEQGIFYHAPNDYSILLLNETGEQNAEINYGSNSASRPLLERWLEYTDLSSDYYFFLKDYSLQLSNREEINAPPVIIYSNIKNGVGIFAGYRTQVFPLVENGGF